MSDSPPLVSIVMAAYQAEKHLSAALDSALAQTYPRIEVIIVDDGSTDTTASILANYATTRKVTVITQPNAGQCAALNRGLATACGDYIKFFDSDDLLAPDAVAIQVAALLRHPPGHIAYGEWSRFHTDPSEAIFTPRPGWADAAPLDWIIATWEDHEPMYQCALWLVPRALCEQVGGWDERLSLINDFEFFTRLVLASSGVIHTPGARLYYRSGLTGSLSRQTSRRAIASAVLSVRLATDQLLARDPRPHTRQLCNDMLQNIVNSHYPVEKSLLEEVIADVRRLGGSRLRPEGGLIFRLVMNTLGWRTALWFRHLGRSLRNR